MTPELLALVAKGLAKNHPLKAACTEVATTWAEAALQVQVAIDALVKAQADEQSTRKALHAAEASATELLKRLEP